MADIAPFMDWRRRRHGSHTIERSISTDHTEIRRLEALIARIVDTVSDKLTAAEIEMAAMRAENDQLRREILAWAREQVREVQS